MEIIQASNDVHQTCTIRGRDVMFKQTRTMTRVVSIAASFALVATLGLSGLTVAAPTQAFADEPASGETAKTDINSIGLSNCGDQYALSGVVDGTVPSAMAYDGSLRDKDRNRVYEGTDYEVAYDWSGINTTTGLGTVKATLTGIGKYDGTISFEYNIVEYVLTISGATPAVQEFNQTTLTQWMSEATDNTEPLAYQYARTGNNPSVFVVPAKSYLTLDTLLQKVGAPSDKSWNTFKAAAADGFSFTYQNSGETYNWYPAMANGSNSTAGATPVPTIFTFQYVEGTGATTAGAIADDLKSQITAGTADLEYVPRTFIGATQSEYTAGDLGGNRFPTSVCIFTVTGFMPFDNITDVPENEWYTPWIATAVNTGIMNGYAGTTKFGPTDTLSRAQAITVLYRAANPDSIDTTDSANFAINDTPLTDNASNQYYTAAVNWAYKNEITTGYAGQNLFGVNDNISRQDLATILARYANKIMGVDTDAATGEAAAACPDWDTVADYAKEAIEWTAANDIMSGVTTDHGSYLLPTANTERAHMAKMILQTLAVAAE